MKKKILVLSVLAVLTVVIVLAGIIYRDEILEATFSKKQKPEKAQSENPENKVILWGKRLSVKDNYADTMLPQIITKKLIKQAPKEYAKQNNIEASGPEYEKFQSNLTKNIQEEQIPSAQKEAKKKYLREHSKKVKKIYLAFAIKNALQEEYKSPYKETLRKYIQEEIKKGNVKMGKTIRKKVMQNLKSK
jgi:hypothetical protein